MKLDDINNTIKLIDKCSGNEHGLLNSIFLDDDIILNEEILTKACILFDSVKVNEINPNIYIRTIFKDFKFEKAINKFKENNKLKIEKCFYGNVEQYNFINFINENKSLVEEGVLIPNVFNKLPVMSDKNDEKILLDLLDKNEGQILNLVRILGLKREEDTFCIDEPLYYLLKIICINQSFLEAMINNKIIISEKSSIAKYATLNAKKINNINVYNNFTNKIYNFDIQDKYINTTINDLILNSFNILVPDFPVLKPDEILEVRYKLKDELNAYRFLIKDIMTKYNDNKYISNDEIIYKEITKKVNDINLKLKSEKSKLFRTTVQYATTIPTGIGILTGGDINSIVISSFGTLAKIICEINRYKDDKNNILKSSENLPYVFLIKAQKYK